MGGRCRRLTEPDGTPYLHKHVGHVHVTSPLREHLSEGLNVPGAPFGITHGSRPCNQEAVARVKVVGHPELDFHGTLDPPGQRALHEKVQECNIWLTLLELQVPLRQA